MSFLKKRGRQVWVPEVLGTKYVPGRWYSYMGYVSKYVPDYSHEVEEYVPEYVSNGVKYKGHTVITLSTKDSSMSFILVDGDDSDSDPGPSLMVDY